MVALEPCNEDPCFQVVTNDHSFAPTHTHTRTRECVSRVLELTILIKRIDCEHCISGQGLSLVHGGNN